MTAHPANSDYPLDVVLRDGSTARIRPATSDDRSAIEWLLQELSSGDQRLRFGETLSVERLRQEVTAMTQDRFTLLATVGEPEHVIAEGGFAPADGDRAMVTITVPEAYRGRGLGTQLLGALARAARERGVNEFHASADPDNHGMLNVVGESGFPVDVEIEPGKIHVRIPTEFTANAVKQFAARDRVAAAQAVRRFLEPRSIAVIGASRTRETIPGTVFHNLLRADFQGPVYPVNPSADVVQSVLAYPSVEDIPGNVDLAVIAVPSGAVREAINECARKGVHSVVIITAGFAEAGEEGRALQDEIIQKTRVEGMRVIGPNCMGILNTNPDFRLDATFAPGSPPTGNVAFASQSGALGMAIMEFSEELGLGVSSFVSLGNKADISGNDLLCYWAEDHRTDVILLYLESFGNPRKFSQIAREIALEKPIVAVKSARSVAGFRAASSHTGALLAASDTTVDALFRQSGVIRTDTLAEMFDAAGLLARQPLPRGPRVAIVTNAGGPGILCADALEAAGAEVPEISPETQARLRRVLPTHAALSNPVDLIASATSTEYRLAVEAVLQDDGIDAVIVINIPIVDPVDDVARSVQPAVVAHGERKPVLFVGMTTAENSRSLRSWEFSMPMFTYPEAAAQALARVIDYAAWRDRPREQPPVFEDIRAAEAALIVASALERGEEWLDPETCWQLLDCYGLPAISQRVVMSIDEIPAAAQQLASRVALKAFGPDILHKTEQGAVEIDLSGPDDARAAAEEMQRRLDDAGLAVSSWTLQSMADDGVEMLIGAIHDPQFGAVIACGSGGVMVELMQDISFRLAPVTPTDAAEMVRELKSSALLTGFRGEPERDIAALEDALLRLGQMVDDLPQIAELDCNPVFVHSQGVTIVDARIRVAAT
jgi:acetate---CoA ligase (ADP-forming)